MEIELGQDNPSFIHTVEDSSYENVFVKNGSPSRSFPDPIFYSWNNVNVHGKEKKPNFITSKLPCFKRKSSDVCPKHIVKNVSGFARPGEILAIMGASGAGKTTLLNVLTFRTAGSLNVSGDRRINGASVEADMLKVVSAYVQQDDIFIGTMTPREHLRFQALLRLDKTVSYKERMARVEEVIQEMGLTGCADTIIGIHGRTTGISAGEKKRLSVTSEIITDPKVLICDEPSSGLDSFMALNLIRSLKTLASQGKTIICTIHQPASEIFALFDSLLLMSEGRVAYFGDAQKAKTHFSTIGYTCPDNYNPADFFIHTLAIRHGIEEDCLKRSNDICDKYEQSENAQELFKNMNSTSQGEEMLETLRKEAKKRRVSPYKVNWFAQFRACLWRSGLTVMKNPMFLKIQLIQTIFVALLVGVIYFGQELDQAGVQNLSGCIFIILANLTFSNIFPVTNVFWQELPVFLRDYSNGMYRVDAYYLAKTMAELPIYICLPIVYISISYYMIGFNPPVERFLTAVLIVVLVANVGSSFGYMASTITSSFNATMALAPVFIMPFMLFGGSFLNKESIPVYFIWLKYLSWFLHGNEALSINQWRDVKNITCDNEFSCVKTGDEVLGRLNFKEDNFIQNLAALGGLIIATRFISFLGLAFKTRRA